MVSHFFLSKLRSEQGFFRIQFAKKAGFSTSIRYALRIVEMTVNYLIITLSKSGCYLKSSAASLMAIVKVRSWSATWHCIRLRASLATGFAWSLNVFC